MSGREVEERRKSDYTLTSYNEIFLFSMADLHNVHELRLGATQVFAKRKQSLR